MAVDESIMQYSMQWYKGSDVKQSLNEKYYSSYTTCIAMPRILCHLVRQQLTSMVTMSNVRKVCHLCGKNSLLCLHGCVPRFHAIKHRQHVSDVCNEIFCEVPGQVALANDAEHARRRNLILEQRLCNFCDGVVKRQLITRDVPVTANKVPIRDVSKVSDNAKRNPGSIRTFPRERAASQCHRTKRELEDSSSRQRQGGSAHHHRQ